MDFISLFTGSENLYKYLFIGGIGLLVLSVFYPLNKKFELRRQEDLYVKQINLTNLEIDQLGRKVSELQKKKQYIIDALDSINRNGQSDLGLKKQLKDSFNRQLDAAVIFKQQIDKKVIETNYNKKRIETLEANIDEFVKYESIFFWSGIVMGLIGILGWFDMMRKARNKS